jgi:hypothetical protein
MSASITSCARTATKIATAMHQYLAGTWKVSIREAHRILAQMQHPIGGQNRLRTTASQWRKGEESLPGPPTFAPRNNRPWRVTVEVSVISLRGNNNIARSAYSSSKATSNRRESYSKTGVSHWRRGERNHCALRQQLQNNQQCAESFARE